MAVNDAEKRRADSFAMVIRGSTVLAQAGTLPTDAGRRLAVPGRPERAVLRARGGAQGFGPRAGRDGRRARSHRGRHDDRRRRRGPERGPAGHAARAASACDTRSQVAVSLPGRRQRLDVVRQPPRRVRRGDAGQRGDRDRAATWWPCSRRSPSGQPCAFAAATARSAGWPTCRTACCCSCVVAVLIGDRPGGLAGPHHHRSGARPDRRGRAGRRRRPGDPAAGRRPGRARAGCPGRSTG